VSNTFGRLFRVTTWGESHGVALGCAIDGCPPGLPLDEAPIQRALDRRRPGQSTLTTPRREADRVEILSGVFEGRTTGTSIGLLIRNQDADSSKYQELARTYRPSHADYTYSAKYGRRDWRGGGRASARETAARVAAGAVAEQLLAAMGGPEGPIEIVAWVDSVADVEADVDGASVTREDVDANEVRCPDPAAAAEMEARIRDARRDKDTVGGCVRCVARGVPPGWGEPVFDKLTARLAAAMMSLPASRGFEMGTGFAATRMRGTAHNDPFEVRDGRVRTTTNHSGGVQGGISNGETIAFRVAFKPVATVFQPQDTVDLDGNPVALTMRGRHDPCVLPRAVPIVEAMAALVLADAALLHRASASQRWGDPPAGVDP
jgi:chorismate synthase